MHTRHCLRWNKFDYYGMCDSCTPKTNVDENVRATCLGSLLCKINVIANIVRWWAHWTLFHSNPYWNWNLMCFYVNFYLMHMHCHVHTRSLTPPYIYIFTLSHSNCLSDGFVSLRFVVVFGWENHHHHVTDAKTYWHDLKH